MHGTARASQNQQYSGANRGVTVACSHVQTPLPRRSCLASRVAPRNFQITPGTNGLAQRSRFGDFEPSGCPGATALGTPHLAAVKRARGAGSARGADAPNRKRACRPRLSQCSRRGCRFRRLPPRPIGPRPEAREPRIWRFGPGSSQEPATARDRAMARRASPPSNALSALGAPAACARRTETAGAAAARACAAGSAVDSVAFADGPRARGRLVSRTSGNPARLLIRVR